jgi:hypothetical protein
VLDLDALYDQKLRYPNFHRRDRTDDPTMVARRWLLIPLTRRVHMLVITMRDADSPVAALLRGGVCETRGTVHSARLATRQPCVARCKHTD